MWEINGRTWDGTVEPVLNDQILRRGLTTSQIGNYTRLAVNLMNAMILQIHTQIHTHEVRERGTGMRTGTGTSMGSGRVVERQRSARNRTRVEAAMWETGES